jgi:hypothetical protein
VLYRGVKMGNQLVSNIATLTGLPESIITNEIKTLIVKAGLNPETIELGQLRLILANYLQDVLLEAKEAYTDNSQKNAV